MNADIEKIKALALAATQGEWVSKHHGVFVRGDCLCDVSSTTGKYETAAACSAT